MQILHCTFMKNVKSCCGSVYSKFERNYLTFNKIQSSCYFGRHDGGQSLALQYGGQHKSYYFVEKIKLP